MPRVVPNQKEKFESDDLMKRHAREGEVKKFNYIEDVNCPINAPGEQVGVFI